MTRTRSIVTATGCIAAAGVAGVLFGINPANGATTIHTTCSGQSIHQQAPYSCTSTKIVDGTTFTSVLNESADGHLSVTISLPDGPRAVPTPIHLISHENNSGSGLAQTDPGAVIPAGSVGPVTLSIFPALCGQTDTKVVFLGEGVGTGRMSGSYIDNDTCSTPGDTTTTTNSLPATSIVQTSTSSPTSSPTSHPRSGSSSSTTPATVSIPHGAVAGTLPKTGRSGSLPTAYIGAAGIAAGAGLLVIARRRAVS